MCLEWSPKLAVSEHWASASTCAGSGVLPLAALRCPVTHIPTFPIPLFYSFPLKTRPYPPLFPPLAAVPSCLASSGRKRGLVLGRVSEQPLSSTKLMVGEHHLSWCGPKLQDSHPCMCRYCQASHHHIPVPCSCSPTD